MHIPDGFLTLVLCAVMYAITILFLIIAFWRTNRILSEKQIPLMATLTAMFFTAQMMNYPIIGGTTAHLLGGPILAITLGPYAGLISMTIILLIQALFFGDGGVLTFGANVFNMGVVGTFIPFLVLFAFLKVKPNRNSLLIGGFLGAFLGDLGAAVAAGLELGLSYPTFPYGVSIALTAMVIHHSIIGIIEGVATLVILLTLHKARPDLLSLKRVAPIITGDLPPLMEGK
ncbi:MAG: energy-coupling factor ABC transporter permease [Promethearchaeota archaeon]